MDYMLLKPCTISGNTQKENRENYNFFFQNVTEIPSFGSPLIKYMTFGKTVRHRTFFSFYQVVVNEYGYISMTSIITHSHIHLHFGKKNYSFGSNKSQLLFLSLFIPNAF